MKIVFLNALVGKVPEIKKFILDQISDTDVFCFQEAGHYNVDIFCKEYLSSQYQLFTCQKPLDQNNIMVNATFIKKNISVIQTQIIGQKEENIGLGLLTQIKDKNNNIFNICNFHGFPWPGDKQDNSDRLTQSELIINSLKNIDGPKIIGGDFNLDKDIKSTQIFEENGFRSLIKEFKIGNTRNQLSWQQYPDSKQYFADHLFISPELKVTYFAVPYNEVSDHLPLIIEVNY